MGQSIKSLDARITVDANLQTCNDGLIISPLQNSPNCGERFRRAVWPDGTWFLEGCRTSRMYQRTPSYVMVSSRYSPRLLRDISIMVLANWGQFCNASDATVSIALTRSKALVFEALSCSRFCMDCKCFWMFRVWIAKNRKGRVWQSWLSSVLTTTDIPSTDFVVSLEMHMVEGVIWG